MPAPVPTPQVRGACPGVAAPMAADDGMLLRVRLPGGAITPAGIRALADVAERYGSGTVELTARANVQIRGVRPADVGPAADRLVGCGLAEADPVRDERRDVVGSPLAGHDPTELLDLAGAVQEVARLLATGSGLDGLAPKFGIVLDGGGVVSVRGVPADVALGAARAGGAGVLVQLELGRRLDDSHGLAAHVPARDLGHVVLVAARLSAAHGERIAALVERFGRADLVRTVTAGIEVRWHTPPNPQAVGAPLGVMANASPERINVGAAPLLGRTSPAPLRAVADLADATAAAVRMTPWRGLVLAGVARSDGAGVAAGLANAGFSLDPADPAHLVSACIGRTGCPSSRADTAAAARDLLDGPRVLTSRIHLAGCEKRCGAGAGHVVVADDHGAFRIGEP